MLAGLLLAGCLPIKSTIQPRASFWVVDQHHHPIDNATVMLVGMHLPSKLDSKLLQLQTRNGRTQIEKQVKWQIGSPFLQHGITYYS